MNRSIAALFLGSFVLLNGCATHTRATTPVLLTISSNTANDGFVKEVRSTTLDAIAAQVPNARPMTIKVDLEVATQSQQTSAMSSWQPQANQEHRVATLSPDPMSEAAPPTVPVNSTPFRTERSEALTDYRVSYTISDAEGHVIESNSLKLDRGHLVNAASGTQAAGLYIKDPLSLRNELVSNTAGFLASRVKTLNQ
jgi:hypothetical protein